MGDSAVDPDEGFAAFVEAELPGLLQLGHLLAANPDDGWDLAQECLVRVGAAWARVDAEQNPAGYARRTLVRLHVSRWRKMRREVLAAVLPERSLEDPLFTAVELRPALADALRTLGSRQRAAVVLRYVYDLSVEDVAAHLGCSVGTVKSQLSRAVDRLRLALPIDPRIGADSATDTR